MTRWAAPVAAKQNGGLQCDEAAQRAHDGGHVLIEPSNLWCCVILLQRGTMLLLVY